MTSPHNPWQQGMRPQHPSGGAPVAPGGPLAGAPVPGGAPAGEAKPPTTLAFAFAVTIIIPLIALTMLGLTYLVTGNYLNGIVNGSIVKRDDEGVDRSFAESTQVVTPFVHGLFIVLIVVSLGLTLLWVLVGAHLPKGKRGARSFLTFLAVVWMVASVIGLIGGTILWDMFSGYVEFAYELALPGEVLTYFHVSCGSALVGMIVFLALAYAGPSNAHIAAVSARTASTQRA